ncbi:MAG: 3-phenylpropionate MFS transporter [Rhodospirillaceae bacterium]|nr:3-phenylpropionate MFS transporter [Rhodospirillales bacterium]
MSPAVRLAAYYCALFAAVGVNLPFWPLWLKDRGLSPGDIGLILAATYLMKMVVNPLVGHVVDRRGDRRRPMVIMAVGAAITWACFALVDEFWGIMAVTVLSLSLWSGIMPVGESLALMITQRHRLDYGRVRLWGSAAFILTAIGVGRLLVEYPPTILVWLIAGTLALTAAACAALPDARVPVPATGSAPLMPLLTSAGFLLFLAAGSLNQVSHTVYYAFSTIHWKAAGIADDTIGLLWSEGVIAEIVLFSMSGRVVRRIGPAGLILIAALCGVIRWGVLGATTELPLLFAAQLLHGATFGCAHLGAMHYIQRTIPAGLSARAQGIYSAVAMGAAPGLMSPLTGRLYEGLGGYAFWVMAGFSLLSTLAAWRMVRPVIGNGGAV